MHNGILRIYIFCNLKFAVCNSRKGGFTLIELIIVLMIIGVVSGLAGIVISRSSGSFELKNIAQDISAVLRYARNQAITEKKTYCFFIDSEQRAYLLYTDKNSIEEKDYSDEEFIRVISKPIPEELQMTVKGKDKKSSFIEFFPVGNSTGGVVEVTNQKGKVYHVTVNRITGKVDMRQGES